MASIQQCPRRLSTSQSCQSTSGLLQLQIPSNSQSTSQHPSPQPALFSSHAHSPQPKVECFSLEGFLYMKCQGGALTFLQSRKRLYFGLEELENKLIYYRDKADFDRKRDCLGTIPLNNALCSLIEGNLCAFVLHTGGKKYVMEAENEMSAHCWLNALQQRRDINDNHVNSLDIPIPPPPPSYNVTNAIRRHRSRSRSEPSDSDSHAENPRRMSRSGRKVLPPLQLKPHENQPNSSTMGSNKATSLPPTPTIKCRPVSLFPTSTIVNTPIAENPTTVTSELTSEMVRANGTLPQNNSCRQNHVANNSNNSLRSYVKHRQMSIPESNAIDSVIVPATKSLDQPSTARPPLWLENWINNWLTDQVSNDAATPTVSGDLDLLSTKSQTGPSTSTLFPSQSGDQGYNAASTSQEPSEVTSRCDSRRTSTSSNPVQFFDELSMLRIVDNRQKERIHELNLECTRLVREVERLKSQVSNGTAQNCPPLTAPVNALSSTPDYSLTIAAQNRFLNSELLRINDRCMEAERHVEQCNKKIYKLETEMEDFKKEYVYLLQSCVRIPLHEHSSCDVVQVKLFGGDVHERRVKMLLERARESDPTLPSFESVTKPGSYHVDDYGFRHSFDDIPLALHYIATQLNDHYDSQSEEYITLKHKWRTIIENNSNDIERNRENRHLCRLGVPRSLRSKVWRILINQQVVEIKSKYGEYYYRNLCSSQGTPAEKHYCANHQKQINLDLLRTMPSNVHFMSASCKGVTHLQAVLRAYCLHNPTIGYCQGMNFLAATALLFVSPEDAFWFLIAITERYFSTSYFDQSLTGAQADQEVLKEIVEQKFPRLAHHLEECDIDLTTITLNWFLALFFDAVPFQTMLRIWDCFLFEGPKVLFRFTIALLGLYEDEILDHSDTISVMKVLKAAVRLTYDIDGLIKYAFDELNPFPSKEFLKRRHSLYLEVLQEKLYKRMQLRRMYNITDVTSNSDKVCDLPIESITFNEFVPGTGYVCAGNQKRGKLSMIGFHKEATNLNTLDIEFDCRPVSMVIFHKEMAFVSLLSGYIVAIHLCDNQAEIMWELKLNDVALKLLHCENRLYCPLANGTLAVLENAFEKMPSGLDLYHIPISAAPITDALLDDDYLYLAVACKIVILNRITLSTIGSIYVASSAAGSHVPMFEKIRAFSHSEHGIWLITAHSALIQLWKSSECQMLFDITYDHSHRKPSFDEDDQFDQVEIYCIMYHENEVWIGTVDGYLMLYKLDHAHEYLPMRPKLSQCQDNQLSCHRYPPGKRLSPIHNVSNSIPLHRQQMYYIPTEMETRVEEYASVNEYPESERQTRKISVIIDSESRKYSVNVQPVRQVSADSANDASRVASSSLSSTNESDKARAQNTPKNKLCKGNSVDSAVSVFSSSDGVTSKGSNHVTKKLSEGETQSTNRQRRKISRKTFEEMLRSGKIENCNNSPLLSMGGSLEYDDYFEIYSESDHDQKHDTGLAEGSLLNKLSINKLVHIPVRKMSSSLFGNSNQLNLDTCTTSGEVSPIGDSHAKTNGVSSQSVLQNGDENNVLNASTPSPSETSMELSLGSTTSTLPKTIAEEDEFVNSTSIEEEDEEDEEEDVSPEELLHQLTIDSTADVEAKNNLRVRRKDLNFDDTLLSAKDMEGSTTEPCWSRRNSRVVIADNDLVESEIKSSLTMALQMKLKISDKPVKCIALTRFNDEDVVLTGTGNYGDEEAILRWRREKIAVCG